MHERGTRPLGGVVRVAALLAVLAVGYLALTAGQVVLAMRWDRPTEADAIVVLGAAQYDGTPSPVLQARLDHAAALYEEGLAPIVAVTGGRQPGDRYSEARASADYLRARGVPDAALRLEVDGRSSWESLAASARFLEREGVERVVLVSDPYHSFRIADIARQLGFTPLVSPARTQPLPLLDAGRQVARETAAVSLGRIVGYRRLGAIQQRLADG